MGDRMELKDFCDQDLRQGSPILYKERKKRRFVLLRGHWDKLSKIMEMRSLLVAIRSNKIVSMDVMPNICQSDPGLVQILFI